MSGREKSSLRKYFSAAKKKLTPFVFGLIRFHRCRMCGPIKNDSTHCQNVLTNVVRKKKAPRDKNVLITVPWPKSNENAETERRKSFRAL